MQLRDSLFYDADAQVVINIDIHPNIHLKNSERTTKQKQRVQIAERSLFLM